MFDDDDDGPFGEGDYEAQSELPATPEQLEMSGISIQIASLPISEGRIIEGVLKLFEKKLGPVIEKQLKEIAESAFADAVKRSADALLQEVLTKPLHLTNRYGEPTGESTTLRDGIEKKFEQFMKQTVNSDGYNSDRGMSRSDWLISSLGKDLVLKAAKVEIEKVREQAKQQISAAVGNFIAQNLVDSSKRLPS